MVDVEEVAKAITMLGIAFKTEYTKEEIDLYYDFLKDYDEKVLKTAIKELIKTNQFVPKISEIIKKCDEVKANQKFEVLEFMRYQGYFQNNEEYEKANKWLRDKIIPEWFKKDLSEYFSKMKSNLLETKDDNKLLTGGESRGN